ncbi:uncharacterized protein LOC116196216 [Punica granatum]|uniref:THUMP domain-containing protein n=2 Tax=Punica granatum TaxID=22663 RepID=A0A218Y1M0_PUNGR|nr:uncharacterized protein LOC116196216 [Punica granatum]OWM90701.1 hypothetical protein CDL15_Pgr021006 [Punica granatum]PKI54869.1 hypothetical protein CRG98_024752 [Punica granatum]
MGSADDGGDEGPTKTVMTPWEQHSAVISIPRFDYNAPASLLHHSHSGFLITCTIKREKSATKEAMAILGKFCRPKNNGDPSHSESEISDEGGIAKRRKVCSEESGVESANGGGSESVTIESKDENGGHPQDACSTPKEEDADVDRNSLLSLVKLIRSGLVLFTFPKGHSTDTVSIVSEIIQSLKSGSQSPPQWCHRIFPIQATCNLNEQALQTVVQNLVLEFMKDKQERANQPIKFAVGYNRRGIEEAELKTSKHTLQGSKSDKFPLLDRNKCFEVVAGAVKGVISDSVVDLKTPELCVLVELLPLSAVPSGSLVVAVSVLPENLITTKPRLCVKALAPDTKTRNGKN